MDEDALQQVVTRAADVAFPGMGLTGISQQVALPSGPCDLRARDRQGCWWVIELKRDSLTPATVAQVLRYKRELDHLFPGTDHRPMIAGLRCSLGTRHCAAQAGVVVHVFDPDVIARLVEQFQVADRRRRRSGDQRTPSVPRGPAVPRGGYSDAGRQELQARLDAAFPPGTLTCRSPVGDVDAYWALACPGAPEAVRRRVSRVSVHILAAEPSSAIVNRASSWSNLKLSNGALVAALDAGAKAVKCDFWLPEDLAGMVPYANKGPRHPHSVWCQPRGLTSDHAVDELLHWYDRALGRRRALGLA